jgi:hypothetical protein
MSAITWYVVPNTEVVPYPGLTDVEAYWALAGNRIVLAGNSALDGGGVRHEMLHALLRQGGHPRSAFLVACGGVVECNKECIADAGPPPPFDPSALHVTENDLELAITVAPAHPSAAVDSGFFTLTVRATNPASVPVIVQLSGRGPNGTSAPTTFSYYLFGPKGGRSDAEFAIDSADTRFGAHETKRQVFDFQVAGDSIPLAGQPDGSPITFPAGTYLIRGAYGQHQVSDTVQIGP